MLLTKSIFPFWCVCALPIYFAKIDILVGDITIIIFIVLKPKDAELIMIVQLIYGTTVWVISV